MRRSRARAFVRAFEDADDARIDGKRDDDDVEDDDVDARTMVTPVTTTRDSARSIRP